jgi:predicted RND superfamily exporter protein
LPVSAAWNWCWIPVLQGTFLKVRYLREVERLQAFLEADGRFDMALSLADYAKLVNRLMDGRPGEPLQLPEEDYLLQEYLGLSRQPAVDALADPSYSRVRILVRHGLSESGAVLEAVAAIRDFVQRELDPALRLRITGDAWISAIAADSMAVGQAESLLLMVGVIFLLVSGLFLELKAGLLALLPNLLPVLSMFAVMALVGLPLSTATAMVAVIAIGVSVDDTLHFLVRYNQEMKVSPSHKLAVLTTLEEEVRPMLSTSLALAAGFLVLLLSSFPPPRTAAAGHLAGKYPAPGGSALLGASPCPPSRRRGIYCLVQ